LNLEMEVKGDWDCGGVVKAADASVKDFRRVGMWTVFEGAVLGRWSASGRETQAANEGLTMTGGVAGIGSGVC
jgi:hypothetical protein